MESKPGWTGSRLHRLWWIGMVIALVVALAVLVQQFRRAERLESRVESLGQELSEARAEIAVHEARMASVRDAVDDLAERVGVLQKVVAEPQRAP